MMRGMKESRILMGDNFRGGVMERAVGLGSDYGEGRKDIVGVSLQRA